MTDSEKLAALRAMVGDDADDKTLSVYLKLAESKVISKAFPFGKGAASVPIKYEAVQLEIAAYLLNKRGAEGQLSHSENGISRSYESADVPPSMLKGVIPCCGVMG